MKQRGLPPPPAWPRGPVVAAGNWEPLIFRQMTAGDPGECRRLYEREHTPALADHLREAGVSLLITHFFKGFGLQAEAEEMAQAEALVTLCHERGIRVAGYIGDCFVPESMLREEPGALEWAQYDLHGKPVTYDDRQTWRYKWCRNNPAYLAYMKKVLGRAAAAGLDMLHFDNFFDRPLPHACHCKFCREKFRLFLEENGNSSPEGCSPARGPAGVRGAPLLPGALASHDAMGAPLLPGAAPRTDTMDPLLRQWILFRCHSLAESLRALAGHCRSLNPGIVLETNLACMGGDNAALLRGVDYRGLLSCCRFFWNKTPNPLGLLPGGALHSNAGAMKRGEALGNRVLCYTFAEDGNEAAVRMGEALAFNGGCLGMISPLEGDRLPAAEPGAPFARLLLDHAGLFCGTVSCAQVALYRDFTSLAFNSWDPHLQALLAEQALLRSHVPFDVLLDLEKLCHALLVVPGMECLSDAQIRHIMGFAARGGAVALVGTVGAYDEWRRRRERPPFSRFRGARRRLRHMAPLELPPQAPGKEERRARDGYPVVDGRFWHVPVNAPSFIQALYELCPGLSSFQVDGPGTLLVEPRMTAGGESMVIHCVNYDPLSPARPLVIRVTPPFTPGRCLWLAPGREAVELPAARRGKMLELEADTRHIYSLILVTR